MLAGLVCVKLDPDCRPLADWFGDARAAPRVARHRRPHGQGPFVVEYPYNWKNLADNYLEGYHIPVGHPGLLRMLDYKRYTPTLGHRHSWIERPLREASPRWTGSSASTSARAADAGLPGRARQLVDVRAHLPLTFLDIYPDQFDTWQLQPLGLRPHAHDLVGLHARGRLAARRRRARKANWHINDKVMDEDDSSATACRTGSSRCTYERGVLNRNEAAVAHFHDMLREAIPGIDDA